MQAILTKILPCTTNKPMRIKAVCQRGSLIVSWHHPNLDDCAHLEDKCARVAQMLCHKFLAEDFKKYKSDPFENPWCGSFTTGGLPDNAGQFAFAHVFKD